MGRLQAVLILLTAVFWAVGCGVVPRSATPYSRPASADTVSSTDTDRPSRTNKTGKVSEVKEIRASLMQAYRDWKGTPYVLGGSSQKGVDCSRLVNIIFDDYFGVQLPTNTRAQLNKGKGIRRSGIRAGDLVFFRTGRKSLHVGIAVNHGEFLHASTSNGVMISKLGNSYWRERFLAAQRIL